MFSRDGTVFFKRRGHQSSPGEVVGSSEQPPRSLLNGQNGFLRKELFFYSCNSQMVIQVSLHFFQGQAFEMRPADDPRGQRPGAMIHQFVEEGVLSAEDERDQGFGVKVKLQQRVELGKDFDAHQVGFINDQDRSLFFGSDFGDKTTESFGEKGDGEATGLDLKGKQDLLEEFEDGTGVGGNGNDSVF